MEYTAEWIARAVDGRLVGENTPVTGGVFTDSRECQDQSLYIARVGENADGHDYLDSAVEHGAVAAIVTREDVGPEKLTRIVVSDATKALGKLAKAHLRKLREGGKIDVIAITGSVGKTTTKDLTAGILNAFGPTIAPKSSFNNEVGMPLTVLRADHHTRYLVLEMGASGPGHLQYLTSIAAPDIAVELTVGRAHLGGFGSVPALAHAKAELVEGLAKGGTAILNRDDQNVYNMASLASGPVVFFSAKGRSGADVKATHIKLDENSCPAFDLEAGDVLKRVHLGLVGRHQVSNALAAISACLTLGLDPAKVVETLNGLRAQSPHRMNVFKHQDVTFIDDSYNANPDSMKAGLEVLGKLGQRASRRIAVLGVMLELGKASESLHREVGRLADEAGVDVLITVGEGAQLMSEPLRGKAEIHHFEDAKEAADLVRNLVQAGDFVFLKGSNGSGVWKIADEFSAKE
ncbi:MAG: UDP-N-acetylmuramoyl-tripeptide--D-alanyl-D-alanine ligase [Actinomycetaceae bacterium]|nr:UDP-N-acetylmuramoyl-tripeptide--D-alanyl-D-alanine ligase [Actinomycetaceae bacterium]